MRLRSTGFTLIELLVVMTMLAMIMVAMGTSLRSMAQTEAAVDARLQRQDQMRVVSRFLHQIMGRVAVVKSSSASPPAGRDVLFLADAQNVSWVGIMPARYGAGGCHVFHLSVERSGQDSALVLRYTPWVPGTKLVLDAQSASHVLAKGVTSLLVEAEGLPVETQSISTDWPHGWQTGWPQKNEMPQRVRLTLTDAKGAWLPIVIQMIPNFQGRTGSGGFVAGGS